MNQNLLDKILELVKEYSTQKNSEVNWTPGVDWVQYSGPVFSSDEYVNAVSTLLKGWLVLGTDAITFENKFTKLLGKEYGIVVNSGSSANLLMMSAMKSKQLYKLPNNTPVIVPVAGFPTTVNPIIQCQFRPIFVDIELNTLNLDLDQVELKLDYHKKINDPIKILTFAHVLGNPPDMDRVDYLVKKYELILLEDCCDALGSTYKDKLLGSFGELSSCSFYPAHHCTMGEGGFVACKTKEQEQVVRSFREWGRKCYCVGKKANLLKQGSCGCRFSNWIPSLPNEIFDHKYVYGEIGYNLKPIELQCSIGLAQLNKLNYIHEKRKHNYRLLTNIFKKYEDVFILPEATKGSNPSWFAFPLTLKDKCKFKKSDLTVFLEDHKIQSRNYFGGNLLLQPAYEDLINNKEEALSYKNATYSMLNTFFLGTSPVITDNQIDYIDTVVQKFFKTHNV